MLDPAKIVSPSDLPQPLPYLEQGRTRLVLGARRPFDFSLNWLRETRPGLLEGGLGVRIRGEGEVRVAYELEGEFRKELSLEEDGWLRLRWYWERRREFAPAVRVKAEVSAEAGLPQGAARLALAIAGVRPQEWLKAVREWLDKAPQAVAALVPGYATEMVRRFFEVWDRLDSEVAASLWELATDVEGYRKAARVWFEQEGLWDVLVELRKRFERLPAAQEVLGKLRTLAEYQTLDEWVRAQIEAVCGRVISEETLAGLRRTLSVLSEACHEIYQKVASALESKYEVELASLASCERGGRAFVECFFKFDAAGLEYFRRAWSGDLSWLGLEQPSSVRLGACSFSERLVGTSTIELHLPFLDKRLWRNRLEVLAEVEVTTDEEGRILVYRVEASHQLERQSAYQSMLLLAGGLTVKKKNLESEFSLSYCDSRVVDKPAVLANLVRIAELYEFSPETLAGLPELVSPWERVEVSMSVSVPGSIVQAWLDAPSMKSKSFFPVYSKLSRAVQAAMRAWLPYVYFSRLEKYKDLEAALPLVVYQASPVYGGKPKYDLCYDVMSTESMESFYRQVARRLPRELERIERLLRDNGLKSLAGFYSPRRAGQILEGVRGRPRLLHALLVGDAFLVNSLVELGCKGAELREVLSTDPREAVKKLMSFAAQFVKAFHGKLRRLYAGRDFVALGSLLIVEATAALRPEGQPPVLPQATLRIREAGSDGVRVLVNATGSPSPLLAA